MASERGRFIRNNIYQIFFIAFPIVGSIYFLIYLSSIDSKNAIVFFLVVILPEMLILSLFFVFVTRLMMKRWNSTINAINFENGKMTLETFPIIWYKPKKYIMNIPDLSFKKSIFSWYGKEKKEGVLIKINNQNELYLVKDYFDDYEVILNKITQKVSW